MDKINLLGYTSEQLQELAVELGGKPYTGKQLFKWIYKRRESDFENMTDVAKKIRAQLADNYTVSKMTPAEKAESSDGTIKYLFKLEDGKLIETVLIPEKDLRRITVCISSQVGCALACRFCATGTMGLLRDLNVGEIVGQLIYLRDEFGEDAFSNVVMMGMGEPLNNYNNVLEALKIMQHKDALNLGYSKVTLSTSGVTPKIKKLADSGIKVSLAISLHAAIEQKRKQIMPIAETFSLEKLKTAIKYYIDKTNSPVMFEYILFNNFNDKPEDIKALGKLAHGLKAKINLLAYNPVEGLPFERPDDEKVAWFGKSIQNYFTIVTIRQSRGRDIDAACGQLAARHKNKESVK